MIHIDWSSKFHAGHPTGDVSSHLFVAGAGLGGEGGVRQHPRQVEHAPQRGPLTFGHRGEGSLHVDLLGHVAGHDLRDPPTQSESESRTIAISTPTILLPFTGPPVPLTVRMHSTPRSDSHSDTTWGLEASRVDNALRSYRVEN
eukprot:1191453-Prorocentrum_minimum.AAC.2